MKSTAIGEITEPLKREERAAEGKTITVSFSGHWAEWKIVTVQLLDSDHARVQARYDTDYGEFDGAIDTSASAVHSHQGTLCLDLKVHLGDGSGIIERWRCEISTL